MVKSNLPGSVADMNCNSSKTPAIMEPIDICTSKMVISSNEVALNIAFECFSILIGLLMCGQWKTG